MPEKELTRLVSEVWPGGLYAFVAGLVNYAWHSVEGRQFRFVSFVSNGFIAGWLGMNVALFVEPGNMQLFIASMSGFCSMPILRFLEKDGWKIIIDVVTKRANATTEKEDSSK